jgi:hypothetical protein
MVVQALCLCGEREMDDTVKMQKYDRAVKPVELKKPPKTVDRTAGFGVTQNVFRRENAMTREKSNRGR